jgi:glycosyltransferase involved in cell wall biosynthesis
MGKQILCSISTRNRYDTTLPMAIESVIMQTKRPDKLVIFDDNDNPKDMREVQHYRYLFEMMQLKGMDWEWVYALKKGQHHNHQMANRMGYEWVWRLDDDTVAEPNVLETLFSYTDPTIGAVGGAVLTPPFGPLGKVTSKIEDIYSEPNIQWYYIDQVKEVDHLHCSFLYRAGVYDYDLSLSRVAHREETLFSYGLVQKGYRNLVVPNAVTWHLKNATGGIRDSNVREWFEHDENIFRNKILLRDNTIVVLDCGMGDHIVFKHVLPDVKNPIVFSCYPNIVPGKSIAEAYQMFGDLSQFSIYRKMDEWNWKGSLEDAFRKLYVSDKK